jgi:hypothetical protein
MVPKKGTGKPKLAIISTHWHQNFHAEHMGDCFMHGWAWAAASLSMRPKLYALVH